MTVISTRKGNPSWFAGKFPKKFKKKKHPWIFHSLHVPRSILHGYLLILTSLLVWKWEYLRSPAKNWSFFAGYLADWQWYEVRLAIVNGIPTDLRWCSHDITNTSLGITKIGNGSVGISEPAAMLDSWSLRLSASAAWPDVGRRNRGLLGKTFEDPVKYQLELLESNKNPLW